MLGYPARVEGDPTLRLDPTEIEEARWFTRDELRSGAGPRALPPAVSLALHLLDRWVDGELHAHLLPSPPPLRVPSAWQPSPSRLRTITEPEWRPAGSPWRVATRIP